MTFIRRAAFILALSAMGGFALAQNLTGSWLEHEIGFLVTLEEQPDGSLTGTLQGAASPLPLENLRSNASMAAGTFVIEGELTGITVQLQDDGETLYIWLYTPDPNGEPVPGTSEAYVASPYGDAASAGTAAAGGNGTAPDPGDEAALLHGTWLSALQFSPDLIAFTAATYYPDGTYESALYVDNMLAWWYQADYTFENGVLRAQITDYLPQMCFRNSCTPAPEPQPEENPLVLLDANAFAAEVTSAGQPVLLYAVRMESGLQPPLTIMPPAPSAPGQPAQPYVGGAGGVTPGMNMGGMDMGMGGSAAGSGDFIQGVIYGQDTYTNPDTGQSYDMDMVGDPGWDYTSPSGNDLSYNEITGTWTETDASGWETELESGW